jgi:ferric-dicitrate binding protein FerR (iron transport regulator)
MQPSTMEEKLARYFAGDISEEDRKEIEYWRSREENFEAFQDAKRAWILSGLSEASEEQIIDEIVQDREVVNIGWPKYLRYGAMVLLVFMLGMLWYFGSREERSSEVFRPFSGRLQTLPDGSMVVLKGGSTLDILEMSEHKRSVRVSGKAYFQVQADVERSFSVWTDQAQVEAMGTRFVVNTQAEGITEVCVSHGEVALSKNDARGKALTVKLDSGYIGMTGRGMRGVVKRRNQNPNFDAWVDGKLDFNRSPIPEVMEVLEDTYDVSISFESAFFPCRLSAQFEGESLEKIINTICETFSWEYQLTPNTVVLSGEGC